MDKRKLKKKLNEAALILQIHNLISESQMKAIWKEVKDK